MAGVLNGVVGQGGGRRRPVQANVKAARAKLRELFVTWMSLPDTQDLVARLADQLGKRGKLPPAELRAALEAHFESPFDRRSPVDPLHLGDPGSWQSPPRSPRHSPSRLPNRQGPLPGMLRADELDLNRHGPASPAGSPRQNPGRSPVARGQSPESAPLLPQARVDIGLPAHGHHKPAVPAEERHSVVADVAAARAEHSDGTRTAPAAGGELSRRRLTGEQRLPVPAFFFPHGQACPREAHEKEGQTLRRLFDAKKPVKSTPSQGPRGSSRRLSTDRDGKTFNQKAFVDLCTKVCQLPKWISNIVFRRVLTWEPAPAEFDREREASLQVHPTNTVVTYPRFKEFYDSEIAGKSRELRLFDVIKWSRSRNHIVRADLQPIVEEVLLVHPGLEFLKSTPDFQERYAETVQIRILFCANLKDDGMLTWPEFQRSSLPAVLHNLDLEQDINVSNQTEYFSYEHFYVLYCKFWELDTDHDFLISKEDLAKYGNYALSSAVIDRVFSGRGRKLSSKQPNRMTYEDFVWFCLCEEDKCTPQSIEYWFRCCDLDSDGILSGFELSHFFQEQKERMESMYQETIAREDILCQMIDMIHPRDPKAIRLADLKACKLSGNFFNSLFNLTKFIAFEQRDPFVTHAEKQLPEKTDWDRFAKVEYERMSLEAGEQEEGMVDDAPAY
eukprot:TRINITY_DN6016_c0_g1_i14.p1 TRINITY_DN6016_c0_g1~~TRINITY_DN6016_c0_g1_i14.p1  ORF type:complete len:721 (+),score=280.14 TRINITY_DN6016_c0_g1_i14:148-2163(+)